MRTRLWTLESDSLGRPNGITYDRANDRFIIGF
jgi:hypothetical protein